MYTQIGASIRKARRAARWSQNELAERAGVSRPTVARIEAGTDVSMATLTKVAGALGLQVRVDDTSERADP